MEEDILLTSFQEEIQLLDPHLFAVTKTTCPHSDMVLQTIDLIRMRLEVITNTGELLVIL